MKKVVALLLLVGFFVFSTPAQAVGDPDDPNSVKISLEEFQEYTAAVENCETPSLECLVRYTTRFVAMEWVNEILGADNKIVDTGAALPSSTVAYSQMGLIPGTFSIISLMYANPPANTRTYVADVLDSAHLAPKAYAQGLGFASLNPVLNLWKAFRNISYFFFIILFIVIGFMIMFRQKIGGQAAITAQQAIPSIVVSLILVTFSYAIAGFMIDLMYLVMFMIMGIFSDIITPGIGATAGGQLIDMNILQLTGTMFKSVWDSTSISQNLLKEILAVLNEASRDTTLANWTSLGGGIIISLVVSLAVLIGAFRLFFELLKSYFSVVVGVVTAPIMLSIGAIPGKNVFWPWLKNLIGNLAAFPTVLLVLVLFLEFTKDADLAGTAGGFMPPYLLGTGAAGIIGPLMGLATILAMPDIVKKAKTAMGATDGGVFWELAGAATKNMKESVRYTPAVGGIGGYGLGMAEGLGKSIYSGDLVRSPLATLRRIPQWGAYRAKRTSDMVRNRFAQPAEQMMEGKFIDPNAWENVILAQGRVQRTKELEEQKTKLEDSLKKKKAP